MSLSVREFEHFRRQGYLRLPSAIAPALTAELLGAVERLQLEDGTPKSYRLWQRAPHLVRQVVESPVLRDALESLLGPNVVMLTNRHNQAALNTPGGTDTRLHRDVLQWSRTVLSAVVYLQDADAHNGCTVVVPGSHLLPTVGVPQPEGGGTWMAEHDEFRDLCNQAVPVPMASGEALLFDGMLFHATGDNHSSTTRAALVLGFRSVDELDIDPDRGRQIVVLGSHIYRGNDRVVPGRDRPIGTVRPP